MKRTNKIIISGIILGIYLIFTLSLISGLIINSVSTSPESISPGDTSKITISLKNNGENDLEDVAISLDFTNLPLAPYSSGSDYNFNELNEGKTKEADFEIIAQTDAKSGLYKIPVRIDYKENDQTKTKNSLISIMINSDPVLDIEAEDKLFLKGQINTVTLKVINKGLADVKFLEIETKGSTSYTLVSSNKVYIGDVDNNDFQTADFKLFVRATSPTNINIPVSIKYQDITNKEYIQDFVIQIKTYTKKQATDLGLITKSNISYTITAIVIVILVFIIYRFFRRRKIKE